LLASLGLAGKRVLFLKSSIALPTLEQTLATAGATVTAVSVYETAAGPGLSDDAAFRLRNGGIAAVAFYSPSSVDCFAEQLAERGIAPETVPAVCIGPLTAKTARERGFAVLAEGSTPTTSHLIDILRDAMDKQERTGSDA
jgi:uroporphyrinogen-III synthase